MEPVYNGASPRTVDSNNMNLPSFEHSRSSLILVIILWNINTSTAIDSIHRRRTTDFVVRERGDSWNFWKNDVRVCRQLWLCEGLKREDWCLWWCSGRSSTATCVVKKHVDQSTRDNRRMITDNSVVRQTEQHKKCLKILSYVACLIVVQSRTLWTLNQTQWKQRDNVEG
jgi:hypothetical protein